MAQGSDEGWTKWYKSAAIETRLPKFMRSGSETPATLICGEDRFASTQSVFVPLNCRPLRANEQTRLA